MGHAHSCFINVNLSKNVELKMRFYTLLIIYWTECYDLRSAKEHMCTICAASGIRVEHGR